MTSRYLLVGLGNPGRSYKRHRHNIGFMCLDQLAREHGIRFARVRHRALVTVGRIKGEQVLLAKPQTFMNESGASVANLVRYYRVPLEQVLVIYDDLDLPLGALRFRAEGGSGGHKGVQSIIEQLGSQAFPRLRLGIGRPPGRQEPADYVLQPFASQEKELLGPVLARAVAGVETYLGEGISLAMSKHNGRLDTEVTG